MPSQITLTQLRKAGADKRQTDLFKELFGESVTLTLDLARKHAQDFDFGWIAGNLLVSPSARAVFDAAIVSAVAAYKIAMVSASASYDAAMNFAIAAYRTATISANVTYNTAMASASAAHLVDVASARAAYKAAVAVAFACAYLSE